MKRLRRWGAVPVVALVIILWRPEPTHRELSVAPLFAVSLDEEAIASSSPGDHRVPFEHEGSFGYLTGTGEISYRGRVAYQVALAEDAFVNYARLSDQLVIQDADGGYLATLDATGYPHFAGERLFLIGPHSSDVAEYALSGDEQWRYDLPSPLVSIAAGPTLVSLGTIGSGIVVLDRSGAPLDVHQDDAGALPLSLAWSPDEQTLAAILGPRPKLVLYRVRDRDVVPFDLRLFDQPAGARMESVRMESVRMESVRMESVRTTVRFSDDGSHLVYAAGPDLRVMRLADRSERHVGPDPAGRDIRPDGSVRQIVAVSQLPAIDLYTAIALSDTADPSRRFLYSATLSVAGTDGVVAALQEFAARDVSVTEIGGALVVTVDGRALGLRMVER